MIQKFKDDLDKMDFKNLEVLFKQENKIKYIILEIIESIVGYKKLLNFDDVILFFVYKLRNIELKRLFFKVIIFFLRFIFFKINRKQFY